MKAGHELAWEQFPLPAGSVAAPARYVRATIEGAPESAWASIFEVDVIGD